MHQRNRPIEFAERCSNGMGVAVVQARQHRPAMQVNPICSRSGGRQRFAVRTYFDETVVGYQERLSYRVLAPLRNNFAIVKHNLKRQAQDRTSPR
ncbi:MAG: hypothetical protein EXQ58_06475 [Acidobacteria bacterium]|nr:hypothetical protein [Acidobacteriota bacterium]